MAKYRSIQTSFWSDSKVVDDFTPEDRYFYLYLLTNEKSNQLGCYELSIKQMCRDTGYNEETIKKLIDRFEQNLELICYDFNTKEILLKNWYKYNWLDSDNTKKCIEKEFGLIKSNKLMNLLSPLYAPYIPHTSNKKKKNNKKNNKKDILSSKLDDTASIFSEIISCFNKIGIKEDNFIKNKKEFHFKNNESNQKLIKEIIDKGYTKEDIFDVIYLKYEQWIENNDKNNKDMSTYYRPSTILGKKFDEYLEEAKMKGIS